MHPSDYPSNFEAVKAAVKAWPDSKEAGEIIYQIESLQIRKEYFDELDRRPGESEQIRRELAFKYRRSEGSIRRAVYG